MATNVKQNNTGNRSNKITVKTVFNSKTRGGKTLPIKSLHGI